jgi:hypothetical protein
MWLSCLALILGVLSYAIEVAVGSPLLRVSPSIRDAHLRWEEGEFSPHAERGNDPFAIAIRNIGDRNAVDLTISFLLNLKADDLIVTAQKSSLFANKPIRGDAQRLQVPTRSSLSMSSDTLIDFTAENVVRREEVQIGGRDKEISVSYPAVIKNTIFLWLLMTSHSKGQTSLDEWRKNKTPEDPTLIMKQLNDQMEEAQRASILVLPELTITIICHDTRQNTYSTTSVIRSIYKYEEWARWVIAEEAQRQLVPKNDLVKAWLTQNRIAATRGDYSIVQPEGGPEKIENWNADKLGAEPSDGQLLLMIPFVHSQNQVLAGGRGVLSFEDENNPSEGLFNFNKSQGLFASPSH